MNRFLALAVPAIASVVAASPLLAQGQTCIRYGWSGWRYTCVQWGRPTISNVPEIDAGAGLLAVAAVAAVLLFVWERRRRAA